MEKPTKQPTRKISKIYFDEVVGFESTAYKPGTPEGEDRWEREGPYCWALLLRNERQYNVVWLLDARHQGYTMIKHEEEGIENLTTARATLARFSKMGY